MTPPGASLGLVMPGVGATWGALCAGDAPPVPLPPPCPLYLAQHISYVHHYLARNVSGGLSRSTAPAQLAALAISHPHAPCPPRGRLRRRRERRVAHPASLHVVRADWRNAMAPAGLCPSGRARPAGCSRSSTTTRSTDDDADAATHVLLDNEPIAACAQHHHEPAAVCPDAQRAAARDPARGRQRWRGRRTSSPSRRQWSATAAAATRTARPSAVAHHRAG